MLRTNLSRAVRLLRRRRGWRQADLAIRAGTSRQAVSRIERGDVATRRLRSLVHVVEALDADISLTVRWQGEDLDRLADAAHAHLVQRCVDQLAARAWETRVEVSFNHFGDRGRVDVLAHHTQSGSLLVVEVKSALGDVQETLGRIDVKARLGALLAEGVGWVRPKHIVPALVIGDSRTARRVIAEHDRVFGRFAIRGRQALAWLRRPAGPAGPAGPAPTGLLWFLSVPDSHGVSVTRYARVRTVARQG